MKDLKLIEVLGTKQVGNSKKRLGLFECFCGKQFETLLASVNSGNTKSCGCSRKGINKTHGMSQNTKEYKAWAHMKERCYNENTSNFKEYGGRGITVCDKWLNSFEEFYSDMGKCPDGFSIDRIDVNGNYEPSNCRWADKSEQNFNIRLKSNNTSGKSGVSLDKKRNKWYAYINFNSKRINLGHFDNISDAIEAREEAEMRYYGYIKN